MTAKTESPAEPSTMAIWDALSKTDPAHTKQFKRAGGFSGTAIKPIWIVRMLTDQFGPCGVGWGMNEPDFRVVPGDNREVLVYCTIACWHGDRANVLYGSGGDKCVTYIKANEKYDRPERWENDDEAFKKAFTDAVGNAFKFLGVGADVHMGLFDDSKYVAEVAKEFEAEKPDKIPGIHKVKERLRIMKTAGNDPSMTADKFKALQHANKADLVAIRDANHAWWTGDGEDEEGFGPWIQRRRAELDPDDSTTRAIADMQSFVADRNDWQVALAEWDEQNETFTATLDGEDSRRFQAARDALEASRGAEAALTQAG